jgi:hypothetical protein
MQKIVKFILIALFLHGVNAWSQVGSRSTGAGNGGNDLEARIVVAKNLILQNISKIERFFTENDRVHEVFSEVDVHLLSKTISKIRLHDGIVIVPDGSSLNSNTDLSEIHDRFKISRTAVNRPDEMKIYYDLEKIEGLFDFPERLFILNFHEILGLMGLERNNPSNKLEENYQISSRLGQFVKKVYGYDLVYDIQENAARCTLRMPVNITKKKYLKILKKKYTLTLENYRYYLKGSQSCEDTLGNGTDLGYKSCWVEFNIHRVWDDKLVFHSKGYSSSSLGNPQSKSISRSLRNLPNCFKIN